MKRSVALLLVLSLLLGIVPSALAEERVPIYGPDGQVIREVSRSTASPAARFVQRVAQVLDDAGAWLKRAATAVTLLTGLHKITQSQVQAQHSMWAAVAGPPRIPMGGSGGEDVP